MVLPMQDTAYILTYRESSSGERRDNLLALRWLERLPLLQVIVFEQDSVPRVDSKPASIDRRTLFGCNAGPFNKSWRFNVAARQTARPILVFADAGRNSSCSPEACS